MTVIKSNSVLGRSLGCFFAFLETPTFHPQQDDGAHVIPRDILWGFLIFLHRSAMIIV